MPPRHGKSQLISEYFTAWYLGVFPERRVILASYAADFAAQWGRKSRDVLMEYGPSLFGVSVRDDSSAAHAWNIAGHTGGMDTAGVGGPITGKGASLLVIDDPVKNWEEASSETVRQKQDDWYQSTAYTRLTPDGAVILVMTRWHEDDLVGRLLKRQEQEGDQWRVIELPAICENHEADPLGRPGGAALWPEQGWDNKRLAQIKANSDPRIWAALYAQKPRPAGGVIFKDSHFITRYAPFDWNTPSERPSYSAVFQFIDSAWKTGAANDYSVIGTVGVTATEYHLLNIWRGRVDFDSLIAAIKAQAQIYKPYGIFVEDKASGISVIQTLSNNTRLPINGYQPQGGKEYRAMLATPTLAAGKYLVPEHAPWLTDFINECLAFPNGAKDDQVDVLSMSVNILNQWAGGFYDFGPQPDINVWS